MPASRCFYEKSGGISVIVKHYSCCAFSVLASPSFLALGILPGLSCVNLAGHNIEVGAATGWNNNIVFNKVVLYKMGETCWSRKTVKHCEFMSTTKKKERH